MMDEDGQAPATDEGDHEGTGNSFTRRAAIIGGAAAIGGVVIWTPESLAVPSRKMRRAQGDIEQAIRIVRSSRVSKSLRAKTLPDLLQVQSVIDSQAQAEAAARRSGSRAVRARAAQVAIPSSLCSTLRAVRNAFAGSPAAASIVPILDRLLATFGCSTGPTGPTGPTGATGATGATGF
jgi:hypothetical protein